MDSSSLTLDNIADFIYSQLSTIARRNIHPLSLILLAANTASLLERSSHHELCVAYLTSVIDALGPYLSVSSVLAVGGDVATAASAMFSILTCNMALRPIQDEEGAMETLRGMGEKISAWVVPLGKATPHRVESTLGVLRRRCEQAMARFVHACSSVMGGPSASFTTFGDELARVFEGIGAWTMDERGENVHTRKNVAAVIACLGATHARHVQRDMFEALCNCEGVKEILSAYPRNVVVNACDAAEFDSMVSSTWRERDAQMIGLYKTTLRTLQAVIDPSLLVQADVPHALVNALKCLLFTSVYWLDALEDLQSEWNEILTKLLRWCECVGLTTTAEVDALSALWRSWGWATVSVENLVENSQRASSVEAAFIKCLEGCQFVDEERGARQFAEDLWLLLPCIKKRTSLRHKIYVAARVGRRNESHALEAWLCALSMVSLLQREDSCLLDEVCGGSLRMMCVRLMTRQAHGCSPSLLRRAFATVGDPHRYVGHHLRTQLLEGPTLSCVVPAQTVELSFDGAHLTLRRGQSIRARVALCGDGGGNALEEFRSQLADIFSINKMQLTSTTLSQNKNEWWEARRSLDRRLAVVVERLERTIFTPILQVAFLGAFRDESAWAELNTIALEAHVALRSWANECVLTPSGMSSVEYLQLLASSVHLLVVDEWALEPRESAFRSAPLLALATDRVAQILLDVMGASDDLPCDGDPTTHVATLIAHRLTLRSLDVLYRACVASHVATPLDLSRRATMVAGGDDAVPLEALSILRRQSLGRATPHAPPAVVALPPSAWGRAACVVAGGMDRTARRLGAAMPAEWRRAVGENPAESPLGGAFYIFAGHGGGREIVPLSSLWKRWPTEGTLPVVFLWGCSSAADRSGRREAEHPPSAYLYAGSPAVVGCRWDVTDGELDRATTHLIQSMARAKGDGSEWSLGEALCRARGQCRLPFLTGAAIVCYGMEVVVEGCQT